MSARFFLLVIAALCCASAQSSSQPGARHAWLIGNSVYSRLGKITAPAENVALLEAALKGANFRIVNTRDAKLDNLIKVRDEFLAPVKPGDVVLIYYSGLAIQARRENHLLPVDYDPATQLDDVAYKAPSLSNLRDALDEKKPFVKMLLLDAPWEVPSSVAVTSRGLAVPDIGGSTEIAIALSAQPGQTVPVPAAGGPTLFTEKLAELIRQPGVPLEDVLLNLQREARSQTQRPFAMQGFTATFYFRAPVATDRPDVKYITKMSRRDRQEYVFIPAGPFMMGCVPADKFCEKDETPQHQVVISKGFWMARTETEILAYKRFVGSDPQKERKLPKEAPAWDRRREKENHPIGGAVWDEARDYCAWVGGRLPTEAEWEYAARAGSANQVWPLDSENSRDKANFSGKKGNDLFNETAPVKSFDPNAFGLFDMAGNMWEWTADWYSPTGYQGSPERDPKGPADGKEKVARGGSWYSDAKKHLRISIRKPLKPDSAANHVGFRCVMDDTPETRKLLE
jgi:formylglycine-generating enzyme